MVQQVEFVGGCNGNTSGIAALVKGMKVEDVIILYNEKKCGT